MTKTLLRLVRLALAALTAGALVLPGTASAQTPVDMPPNQKPFPANNFSLVTDATGTTMLRFNTVSWNSGTGALELVAGSVDTGSGKQQVYQRVYLSDGTSYLHFAGWFQWHPTHNHFHFDDYALYTLQPINAPGGSVRTGSKTTFCVMDNTKVDTTLPGAPANPVYSTCGNQIQGMSVGWGDTYGSHLDGQGLDFTDNPDGVYQVKIEIDPKQLLIESNKGDNVACALVRIQRPTVTVLDASGSCEVVTSITPNSAQAGTTVQVSITGFGFSQGMGVTFEKGTGPRPVASNVTLVTDSDTLDTITATVSIPSRKQLGKHPVWDLRVGDTGVLKGAFTVTK